MFLIYLFIASFSLIQPDFNFQSPIVQSNISEVGVWALRGSAINMKKFIRLTSLLTNDYGGLCAYQRTLSADWQINFNFSLQLNKISFSNMKKNMKKSSIIISFTNELCPESFLSWNGFKFIINITSVNDDNKLDLAFSIQTNDGTLVGFSKSNEIKSIPYFISSKEHFFAIQIDKQNENFDFSYLDDQTGKKNEYQKIYSMKMNMTTGYFSVINQISDIDNDNFISRKEKKSNIEILNGLYSIKISQKVNNEINETEMNLNRKYLSSGSISRSFSKQKRKISMKKVNFYREEMEFNSGKLNAGTNQEEDEDEKEEDAENYNQTKLKDSFIEINEMIRRADQDLTLDDLHIFITQILNVRLNSALSKIEKISNDLTDLKLDLIQTWNNVKDQLFEISVSIHSNFDQIKNETEKSVVSYVKEIRNVDSKGVKIKIPGDLEKDAIIKLMFIVCVIEFVGFVAFFCVKRKATNNWKKID